MFVCMCCTFFFIFGEKGSLGMVAPSHALWTVDAPPRTRDVYLKVKYL